MNARAALRSATRPLPISGLVLVAAVLAGLSGVSHAGEALPPSVPSVEHEPDEELVDGRRRLDPDRPHFPEAATTVGNRRAMLESGYTFTDKRNSVLSHSYPEALLRVGVLADWFEVRAGQSFLDERRTVAGATTRVSGAQDLYLGAKLALSRQNGWLPALAVIPQTTVPTGSKAVTSRAVLPGVNVDAAWEVVEQVFGIELSVANNRVRDDRGVLRHELATGLTGVFQLSRQLELFAEWDAFYPVSGAGPAGARDDAVTGLVYFVTPDFAVDTRVGVGLDDRANSVLVGIGFAVRY